VNIWPVQFVGFLVSQARLLRNELSGSNYGRQLDVETRAFEKLARIARGLNGP